MLISDSEHKKINQSVFDAHYANFLNKCGEQGWDVKMILDTEKDHQELCKKFVEEIDGIKKQIDELATKKDKLSREQLRHMKDVLKARELSFNILKVGRSDQYKAISERAKVIDTAREKLKFRKDFDYNVPRLPFIETEGTKYEADSDNDIKLDDKGNKVLHLKNESANTTKAA